MIWDIFASTWKNLRKWRRTAAWPSISHAFRALDQERRERITAAERMKAERNKASEEIARRKRAGEDASEFWRK